MLRPRHLLALAFSLALSLLRAAPAPEVIPLWPEGVPGLKPDAGPEKDDNGRFSNIHQPSLVVYRPAAPNGTAVLYAAGGGYQRVAVGAGGGEITRWLNGLGLTVFVLKYRHADYGQPAPLQDSVRAVRIVRSRAADFGLKPDRIGMLGGSAGAHVTASAGTLFAAPEAQTGAALDAVSGRPDFMILVFPVITMENPHAHGPSRRNLLGAKADDPETQRRWSVDRQTSAQTPPAFLVHSSEDTAVVVENSLLFYAGMRRAGAPIEMHLYPKGPHGAGMAPALGPTAEWPRHCESWLRFNGWLPPKSAIP